MLKVVHINTYDGNGGAGKACLRLNEALLAHNVDSKVIVHYKFNSNSSIEAFDHTLFEKGITAAKIILERVLGRRYLRANSRTPFSFIWFTRNVTRHPAVKNADVVHLHWVNHGLLNPNGLKKLAKLNKPIVWTFHDSNAFTGGCHVRYNCDHFQHACGYCPLLAKPDADDISNKIWHQKYKAYKELSFTTIAPSTWMLKSVALSSLLRENVVRHIGNTLSTSIFKNVDKQEAKKKLGLSKDSFIFLSGFMPSRKDLHKGTDYLIKSLDLLSVDESVDTSKVELLIFGNRNNEATPILPFKTTFLGTINAEQKLADCYAAADGYLIPSLEDNLPYTVMESLACGTPVIAFTTGGIPDMVQHKVNGYLAAYKSAESFCRGMSWLLTHPNKASLQQNARQSIMDTFSENIIAQKHIDLYKDVLAAQPAMPDV